MDHPSAPSSAAPARVAAPKNSGVVIWCILLLAAIFIPWNVVGDRPTWSWVFLETASRSFTTFAIGEWICAGVILILACIVTGLPFSITVTGLAAVSLFLMLDARHGPWDDIVAGFRGQFTSRGPTLDAAAFLSALCLYAMGSLRLRLGPSILMGMATGMSAAACTALGILTFFPAWRSFTAKVDHSSLKEVVASANCIELVIIIALGFTILGAILAFIHACGVRWKHLGYTEASMSSLRVAFGLVLLGLIVIAGIDKGSLVKSLHMLIFTLLFLPMPMLAYLGAVRIVGDLLAPAQEKLLS